MGLHDKRNAIVAWGSPTRERQLNSSLSVAELWTPLLHGLLGSAPGSGGARKAPEGPEGPKQAAGGEALG